MQRMHDINDASPGGKTPPSTVAVDSTDLETDLRRTKPTMARINCSIRGML